MASLGLDRVRSLAGFRTTEAAISCFLDLDPRDTPTGRALATRVTSLADALERTAVEAARNLEHDAATRLHEETKRLRRFLEETLDREGARGIALFVCRPENVWEQVDLPGRIEDGVDVGSTFALTPLAPYLERDREVVLVAVGRDRGELWRLRGGEATPLEDVSRDGQGRHDQGGWSQARYARSREKEALDHMRRVADLVAAEIAPGSERLLVVASVEGERDGFADLLEPHLREAFLGFVPLEKQDDGESLRPAAERLLDERLAAERSALLAKIAEERGQRSGLAVDGWDKAIGAATEGRLEYALLEPHGPDAFECPACGRGYPQAGTCEIDSTPLDPAVRGASGTIVRGTLANGGEVRAVEELAEGVAALARYPIGASLSPDRGTRSAAG